MKKYKSFQLFICQVGFYLRQNRYAVMCPGISFVCCDPAVGAVFLSCATLCFILLLLSLAQFFLHSTDKKKKNLKYKYCPVSRKKQNTLKNRAFWRFWQRIWCLENEKSCSLQKQLYLSEEKLLGTSGSVITGPGLLSVPPGKHRPFTAIASYRLWVMCGRQSCPHPSLDISLDVRVRIILLLHPRYPTSSALKGERLKVLQTPSTSPLSNRTSEWASHLSALV